MRSRPPLPPGRGGAAAALPPRAAPRVLPLLLALFPALLAARGAALAYSHLSAAAAPPAAPTAAESAAAELGSMGAFAPPSVRMAGPRRYVARRPSPAPSASPVSAVPAAGGGGRGKPGAGGATGAAGDGAPPPETPTPTRPSTAAAAPVPVYTVAHVGYWEHATGPLVIDTAVLEARLPARFTLVPLPSPPSSSSSSQPPPPPHIVSASVYAPHDAVLAALVAARAGGASIALLHHGENTSPAAPAAPGAPPPSQSRYAAFASQLAGVTHLSAGLVRRLRAPNYLRYPYWALYLPQGPTGARAFPPELAQPHWPPPGEWAARPLGSMFINSHAAFPRAALVAAFSAAAAQRAIGRFSSIGSALRTDPWPTDAAGSPLPKRAAAARARFLLCPENSLGEGYVTEKVFEAHLAGAVPVYWGAELPPEPGVLNGARVLLLAAREDDPPEALEAALGALTARAAELVSNATAREAFFAQPILTPGAQGVLEGMAGELTERMRALLGRTAASPPPLPLSPAATPPPSASRAAAAAAPPSVATVPSVPAVDSALIISRLGPPAPPHPGSLGGAAAAYRLAAYRERGALTLCPVGLPPGGGAAGFAALLNASLGGGGGAVAVTVQPLPSATEAAAGGATATARALSDAPRACDVVLVGPRGSASQLAAAGGACADGGCAVVHIGASDGDPADGTGGSSPSPADCSLTPGGAVPAGAQLLSALRHPPHTLSTPPLVAAALTGGVAGAPTDEWPCAPHYPLDRNASHWSPPEAWCALARACVRGALVTALRRGAPEPPHPAANVTAHALTYGSERFRRSRERLGRAAAATGAFARVWVATPDDITPAFRASHADVLRRARGGGYWAWKPHLLQRVVGERLAHGGVVVYIDSGCVVNGPPTRYIAAAARAGSLAFRLTHPSAHWTKGAAFAGADMPPEAWGAAPQLVGTAFAVRRDPLNVYLLGEWAALMRRADVATDDAVAGVPAPPGFVDHRHDQAVWSLLLYRAGGPGVGLEDETWPPAAAPAIGAARIRE